MDGLIRIATVELAGFLSAHLPTLGEDWWKRLVEDRLSFQQQRMVQERKLTTLRQLDLAALLRILDRNWPELSQVLNLPREGRTWGKELQTVRNKWAHQSTQAIPADDIYRDADTLGRFLDMLGAAPESVAAVEALKTNALADMATARGVAAGPSAPAAARSGQAGEKGGRSDRSDSPELTGTMFQMGDLVALRSAPGSVAPIIGVVPGEAETRYHVFLDNRKATYYESQLQRPAPGFGPAGEPRGMETNNQAGNRVISMRVSSREAAEEISRIPHQRCQNAFGTHWHIYRDENGREQARAQSICWLYCWAETGQGSRRAQEAARQAFDNIFDRSYDWLHPRLPSDKARELRRKPESSDIEREFDDIIGIN